MLFTSNIHCEYTLHVGANVYHSHHQCKSNSLNNLNNQTHSSQAINVILSLMLLIIHP